MAENNEELQNNDQQQDRGELTEPTETAENIPVENISLGDAMAGVFSEPGETFEAVKSSTKKNYWLVPLLILIVITMLSSFLAMRDEELSSEIRDKQKQAVKERLDEQVRSGNMTREQAEQQMAATDKMFSGSMMIVFAMIGSFFGLAVFFFLKALINWGGLKIFKGTATYTDNMNVLGLASLITSIQMVINTVMAIIMGKLMVNIGPVLFVTEEAVGKNMYTLLANIDLFNFWYLIVLGIGLAKVSNLKTSVTMPFVFVLWLAWVLLASYGPLGFLAGR